MNKRDKTVYILRNSDPSQDMSLESQREEADRFAKEECLDVWRAIEWVPSDAFENGAFIDDSISGAATEKRRGFKAMIEACQDPRSRIRYVVCYDINRFGRFDSDEAGHYRHLLKQCGVEVLYVAEGFRGDDSDELLRGVKQWQGHKYLKDLSKVTQRGLIRLAQKGFWLGGIPSFGYDLRVEDAVGKQLLIIRFECDGTKTILNLDGSVQRCMPRGERIIHGSSDRARLYPSDQARVDLIIEIFEMYASGLGCKAIADILNRGGIPTPRDGNWSGRHKPGWGHGTVNTIVQNPVYLGRLVFNRMSFSKFHHIKKTDAGPRSVRIPPILASRITKLPKEDWITANTAHPAIITQDLWNRAQAERQNRRKPHAKGSQSIYPFSGLIDCAACDHHFQGHTTAKSKLRKDGTAVKTRSYLCGGYDSKGTAICSLRWSVNEDVLWRSTMDVIQSTYAWLFESPKFAEAVERRTLEILNRPTACGPGLEDLRSRLAEIDDQIGALVSNLSPQNLAMLDGKLTELREEREALQQQIDGQKDTAPSSARSDDQAVNQVGKTLVDAFKTIDTASPALKRRFVRQLVERIEIDPRKKTGTAWIWRLPKSVLDSLGMSVSRIAGTGLEPATSGL